MLAELGVLPYHPYPLPEESLSSYLLRLAEGNGYAPVRIFMNWMAKGAGLQSGRRLIHATPEQLLPSLCTVTTHSIASLYLTLYHQFAPVLVPPNTAPVWWQTDQGQRLACFEKAAGCHYVLRRRDHNAFCPLCLREATYQRVTWMLKCLVVCPRHQCYLVEGCPQCGEHLPLASIMQGHCGACDFDLRTSPVLSLPENDLILQAQQCIAHWLTGQRTPAVFKLPQASGQLLFRILDGLHLAAHRAGADWAGAYIPTHDPPDERYAPLVAKGCAWASALRGLMNWPEGFFDFLERYRFRSQPFPVNSLRALSLLYSSWIQVYWQQPDFDFLQAAFNQYLVQYFPPSHSLRCCTRLAQYPELNDQFAYIDVRNAARLLDTSPPAIQAMVRDGLLAVYPERDASRPGIFLYRSQVETAVLRKYAGFSRQVAAQKLGVHLSIVDKLLKAELLHQTGTSPYVNRPIRLFQEEDIEVFQTQLAQVVHREPKATSGRIQLVRAAEINGKIGLSIPQLLQRVLDGKLPAYHAHPRLFPLNDLSFDPPAIAGLVQHIKAENDWMGFLEVVAWLGVSRPTLHDWMEQGLLVPRASFARAQYFSKAEVMQWKHRLMTSHEVAHFLGTDRGKLSVWVRTGYMKTVSQVGRYLFDRQHIEQWHQHYITLPELMVLWNTTPARIRQWRESGLLTPVNAAHTHPWFYSRAHAMRLQKHFVEAQKL